MLFTCIVSWGIRPKPRHKGLFVKSPLESQKLHQNKVVYSVRKFCVFLRGFFKSLLKQGSLTQFQLLTTIKKTRQCRVFSCKRYQLGRLPQTLTKGLFVKSPLEPQKLHQNKVVYFEGNSLAHLSYKKGVCVRLLFF